MEHFSKFRLKFYEMSILDERLLFRKAAGMIQDYGAGICLEVKLARSGRTKVKFFSVTLSYTRAIP